MVLRGKHKGRDCLALEQIAHALHANQLVIDLRRLAHTLSCQKLQEGALHKVLVDFIFSLRRIF